MSKTALKIIEKALRVCKVLDANQPLQAIDRNTALEALNDVVRHLPSQYNHLWTQTQAVLLMEKGKQFYRLGPNGDKAVKRDDLTVTSMDATTIQGATVIPLSSVAGAVNGYGIGIILQNGTTHWSTLVGSPSGNNVTIAQALPDDAQAGATVYIYSALIQRPQQVINAQFANAVNSSEIPVDEWSRDDYFDQPVKNTQGNTSNYYYSPQLGLGELYVWPTAYNNQNIMNFTYIRPIEVTEQNADQVDFPAEWYLPLAYKVAEMLCDEYYVTPTEQQLIKMKAEELMANVLAFDNSGDSIRIELFRW